MGIAKLNISETPDPKALETGQYNLSITKASVKASKSGNPMVRVMFKADGEIGARPISHFINLPTDDMDDETAYSRRVQLKQLCTAIRMDPDVFEDNLMAACDQYEATGQQEAEIEGLKGETCEAIVDQTPSEDGDEVYNGIKRFV